MEFKTANTYKYFKREIPNLQITFTPTEVRDLYQILLDSRGHCNLTGDNSLLLQHLTNFLSDYGSPGKGVKDMPITSSELKPGTEEREPTTQESLKEPVLKALQKVYLEAYHLGLSSLRTVIYFQPDPHIEIILGENTGLQLDRSFEEYLRSHQWIRRTPGDGPTIQYIWSKSFLPTQKDPD